MLVDLSTQTRELFSEVDLRQLPIDVAEIITLTESLPASDLAGFSEGAPAKRGQRQWWRNATAAVAAVVAVLLLVGGAAWLSRSVEPTDPADQTTTTEPETSPPTSLAIEIVVPAPESLNRQQMEHQAEFLSAFQALGFIGGGGCSGGDPGPYECEAAVYPPTLGGPVGLAFTVVDQDAGGRDPGEVSGPDDMQRSSLHAAAVRDVAEDGLAALYAWALTTHPDDTLRLCQSGFTGDNEYVAWNPGYVANYQCGAHLAGLLVQFSPAEAPLAQQLPSSEAGVWYPVPGALEGADSERWDDTLFDLVDTPHGIIGTSGQGLWISQDGVGWKPYARDAITIGPGCESWARIASSRLGIFVLEPCSGPSAWHTGNGTEWVEVKIPELAEGASARIAATNEAFVVAAQGRIWRSVDGSNWTEAVVDPDAFDGGVASIYTLEATPHGFVAGGSEGLSDSQYPVIWHSVDGIAWTKVAIALGEPKPGNESISDLAGSELGVVAVTTSGAVWFSPNAVDWTEVLTTSKRASRIDSAAGASSSGFVLASDDWLGGSIEPQVLASLDGTAWFVVSYAKPGGKYPTTHPDEPGVLMREAISLGNGFLIATEGGTSPIHIYEP